MSFVFYDTETTGIDKHFDQVLQFAAIRTDAELNEIDRIEMRCRLSPFVVPAPAALKVTRVAMPSLLDSSLPSHYGMICSIAEKLASWGPAVFTGWNTLEFDEHMLRQAFYQCLHKPYLTNTNGNCRADILKMAQLAFLQVPGALSVPRNERGNPVFKLDQLAPANGFNHSNAHDAMADVEATIHMARLIRERAPDVWSSCLRFSQKAAVLDFIEEEPAFLLSEFYFGKPYQFAICKVGSDPDVPGYALCLDLAADVEALRAMSDDQLAVALHRSPKVIRKVRANACPNIQPVPDAGWQGRPVEELLEEAEAIRADVDFCSRLIAAYAAGARQYDPAEHVEQRIYDGFTSNADLSILDDFHRLPWASRLALLDLLEDRRLAELGARLIFLHDPDCLPPDFRNEHARLHAQRIMGHGFDAPPWRTLDAAEMEAVALIPECDEAAAAMIDGLRAYIAEQRAVAVVVLAL